MQNEIFCWITESIKNKNSATSLILHKRLIRVIYSIISLLGYVSTSSTSLAQESTGQFSYGPLNPEYVRDAFDRNTIKLESGEEFESIPAHSLYGSIFGNILVSGDEYRHRFSINDWVIIQSLPSHNDVTILGPQLQSIKAACYTFENPITTDTNFEQQLSLYAESAFEADAALDRHYLNVLGSLSTEGKDYIATISESYRKNNSLAFSRVDLQTLGAEIPGIVKQIIQTRCVEAFKIDPTQLESGLMLKDTIAVEYQDFRR